jgi:hypothetical protein
MELNSAPTFDFLPLTIRVATLGGIATPVVLRGTPLPATRAQTYSTAADNQTAVDAELCIGERPLTRDNVQLGKVKLHGIPALPQGKAQIMIEFSVSSTCAVTIRGSVQGAEPFAEMALDPPSDLSEGFVANKLSEAELNRAADEAEVSKIEATKRAKALIAQAEQRLRATSNDRLSSAVADLGLALASKDSRGIREKGDALAAILERVNSDFSDIFGSFFGTVKASRHGATPARSGGATGVTPPRPDVRVATASKATPQTWSVDQQLSAPSDGQELGRIFGGSRFTLDTQLCFILMPFASKFQSIYDKHIKPTVRRAGLTCVRADDIQGTNQITWDIWEYINRSRFLVAELTDQNPNVFYELGLAHALSKDVVLITQSMEFVSFDLKAIRCIVYASTPSGMEKLDRELAGVIAALMKSA